MEDEGRGSEVQVHSWVYSDSETTLGYILSVTYKKKKPKEEKELLLVPGYGDFSPQSARVIALSLKK